MYIFLIRSTTNKYKQVNKSRELSFMAGIFHTNLNIKMPRRFSLIHLVAISKIEIDKGRHEVVGLIVGIAAAFVTFLIYSDGGSY